MKLLAHSSEVIKQLKKLNTDCNMTAGFEAILLVAVGTRVMLCRNIDTSQGLVSGALSTVISIKTHHISVHMSDVYT